MSKIIPYANYKAVLKYPRYELGVFDCYTVIKDVLKEHYGIVIPNYARPFNFHLPPLDLFSKIAKEDFFIHRPSLDFKEIQAGDILSFKVKSDTVNHVGIYLGNGLFLHQLYNSMPREDSLSLAWMRRLAAVHYHEQIEQEKNVIDFVDIMPDYLKDERYVEQPVE